MKIKEVDIAVVGAGSAGLSAAYQAALAYAEGELLDQYLHLLNRPKQLQRRLLEKIASQRAFWRSKPGLKRLAVHPIYR